MIWPIDLNIWRPEIIITIMLSQKSLKTIMATTIITINAISAPIKNTWETLALSQGLHNVLSL